MNRSLAAPSRAERTTQTSAASVLQRQCACGAHTPAGGEWGSCAQKKRQLQRRAAFGPEPEAAVAPPIVHEVLRGPGRPLDEATRGFFEPRFGHDFSHVRVHTDERAAAASANAFNVDADSVRGDRDSAAGTTERAHSLPSTLRSRMERHFNTSFADVRIHADARAGQAALEECAAAFTRGNEVYFSPGRYQPETDAGLKLLAHELAHVVQQRQGRFPPPPGSGHAARSRAALEAEADRAAALISSVPAEIVGRASPDVRQYQLLGDLRAFREIVSRFGRRRRLGGGPSSAGRSPDCSSGGAT